jgi:mono/diheme cytochrome c family protein
VRVLVAALLSLAASHSVAAERWYNEQQVIDGKQIFLQNCASCHGPEAASTANWKQTDANGKYPPPPLNGSAHAWHHDLPLLRRTVREGGQKMGGLMPPFKDTLKPEQIDAAIAYFQSMWPDEIYQKWAGRFLDASKTPPLPTADDLKKLLKPRPNLSYLQQRLGKANIGAAQKSPINKLYKIRFKDKTLFLSEDGQYAIIGDMIDLKNGKNLSR